VRAMSADDYGRNASQPRFNVRDGAKYVGVDRPCFDSFCVPAQSQAAALAGASSLQKPNSNRFLGAP